MTGSGPSTREEAAARTARATVISGAAFVGVALLLLYAGSTGPVEELARSRGTDQMNGAALHAFVVSIITVVTLGIGAVLYLWVWVMLRSGSRAGRNIGVGALVLGVLWMVLYAAPEVFGLASLQQTAGLGITATLMFLLWAGASLWWLVTAFSSAWRGPAHDL
ncbi:hypothetical protein [Nesterenkonia flava]|uniref:Uncharacterized protein n=1 Tax=Nesterenkonia flava TaxID=469799 RepID=A0ABU1FVA8_9MICC|nr:hypothetical protein [Nesterenkonia flava]MDR5712553.1 hypothetical protein [Nesterenkonia flava]